MVATALAFVLWSNGIVGRSRPVFPARGQPPL